MAEMNIPSEGLKSRLQQEIKNFDFLRFSAVDTNGVLRGKIVPQSSAARFVDQGIGVYAGLLHLGHRTEVPHFKEVEDINHGNYLFMPCRPIINTPWAFMKTNKSVGLIMCESVWAETMQPFEPCPRFVVRKQMERLAAKGFEFRCGFEFEFHLRYADTKLPVNDGFDAIIDAVLFEQEEFVADVYEKLAAAGTEVEQFHSEYSFGQFEIATAPGIGMDGMDSVVLVKECVKEVARKHGLEAIFMTRPYPKASNSAMHLNHSILNKKGESLFGDPKNADGLSDIGRYWLGGLIKHTGSLCSLYSPTVNCYRRFGMDWCPSKCNWGTENRSAAFRVKNTKSKQGSVYIENRLVTGSSNPYLTVAAVIAAGLDGIENKIDPPMEDDPKASTLPANLEETLTLLEADEAMKDALGSQFVRWLCQLRRDVDLTKLKDTDLKKDDEEALAKEQTMYLKFA